MRLLHRRIAKPPPPPEGFNSLHVHVTALKRPCPRCGGKMYRDEWGDDRTGWTKLHCCVECGFERPTSRSRVSDNG